MILFSQIMKDIRFFRKILRKYTFSPAPTTILSLTHTHRRVHAKGDGMRSERHSRARTYTSLLVQTPHVGIFKHKSVQKCYTFSFPSLSLATCSFIRWVRIAQVESPSSSKSRAPPDPQSPFRTEQNKKQSARQARHSSSAAAAFLSNGRCAAALIKCHRPASSAWHRRYNQCCG